MRTKLIPLFLFALPLWAQPRLIVALRVDDIMSRSTTVLPRSIRPFEQAAEQRGAKVTWVTIPHRLIENTNADGSLTQELRSSLRRGHEISQHGYNHICMRCGQSGHEMWCASQSRAFTYAEQTALVVDGLMILRDSLGIRPRSFVSPGHQEDSTTYAVLADQGFEYISTTRKGSKQAIYSTLYNMSHDAEYTWALTASQYQAALDSALAHVQTKGEQAGCYVFLFHDYFIRQGYENGVVIRWLGELLDSLTARYGSRLEFRTLSGAAEYCKTLTAYADTPRQTPTTVFLSQNYPNPFNTSTTIWFKIPTESRVRIEVFDALGRGRVVLMNDELPAGSHTIQWDAATGGGQTPAASGVYFARIEAIPVARPQEPATHVRRMILLR